MELTEFAAAEVDEAPPVDPVESITERVIL